MARKAEPDLTTLFLAAGAGGAILGAGMLAASKGIGQAIGTTIANTVNAKRARDWQAAVVAKAGEAERLLAEFDRIRGDLAIYPELLADAVGDHVRLKYELESVLSETTVFDAYDELVALITRIDNRLSYHRSITDALFNAAVTSRLRAAREQEAAG